MWVFGEVTLQLELGDQSGDSWMLDPAAATDPEDWTKLAFAYAGAPLDLRGITTVKIFIAPESPVEQGRFVLDEIILVP